MWYNSYKKINKMDTKNKYLYAKSNQNRLIFIFDFNFLFLGNLNMFNYENAFVDVQWQQTNFHKLKI